MTQKSAKTSWTLFMSSARRSSGECERVVCTSTELSTTSVPNQNWTSRRAVRYRPGQEELNMPKLWDATNIGQETKSARTTLEKSRAWQCDDFLESQFRQGIIHKQSRRLGKIHGNKSPFKFLGAAKAPTSFSRGARQARVVTDRTDTKLHVFAAHFARAQVCV